MTWTRRMFVRDTLKGWIGLVLAPSIYSIVRMVKTSFSDEIIELKDIGPTESIEPSGNRTFFLGRKKVIVARTHGGEIHAVSATCTHLGCSIRLDAQNGNQGFACNCHASRFSLDGENLGGPATVPLEKFRVETRDGRMLLSEIPDTN